MTPEELITSGQLELFVYGSLSPEENEEIIQMAKQHEIIREEIAAIETALYRLSTYSSPYLSARNYERIKAALNISSRSIGKTYKTHAFIGYAASILFLIGLGFVFYNYNIATENYEVVSTEKTELKNEVEKLNREKAVLNEIRETTYTRVALGGQTVAPNSSASIYWDQESHQVYVDVKNLPEPPEGKVYQVWSLQLEPALVPTSIGVLDGYVNSDIKIFKIDNVTEAQGFGITLEPEGGSETPTLTQLYTLGKV
ncbi:anti-sigma factor [Neptunitalea lumnitzerae]|uniref:Anti-sigma K factor RskA C-terminal domain-containing protein n=1 Tax=Neptunitalea lumnitzerae TaxID=2965509 RepID=A0ABQ5ML15_9FLAO|nr:anti-sigma factor [Neptunitalea sp. Y10]GLB49991.1 hypothetical protein Y10_23590 [Neptunitalea sp. Y10]